MNTITSKSEFGTKEYLKEKLLGLETIYVVYLNENGTRMQLYYINKDTGKLEKVWIAPKYNENTDAYDLKKTDKPVYWSQGTKYDTFAFCFRVNAYGTSRSLEAIHSLYYWLGEYDLSKMPRSEQLN